MNNKIYVGNLPYSVTTETMSEMFSGFGKITDNIIISDRETGRSKGFGFVTFESQDSAENAVKEMNGKEISGRKIKVNIAQEKTRTGGGSRGAGSRGGYSKSHGDSKHGWQD